MATLSHQPSEYKLVGGWKQVFGQKQVVAGPFLNQTKNFQQEKNNRNFGAVAGVDSVFPIGGLKQVVLTVFRALGVQNGTPNFSLPPRRSYAAAEPSAPRLPFIHNIVGF